MLQRAHISSPVRVVERLDALTGLRFFAAAAIVYLHYEGSGGIPVITSVSLGQGVSFFFVLSGFVLTYKYPSLPSWRARRDFMVARIARIWPAHLAVLTLAIFLSNVSAHDIFNINLVVNALMLHAWWPVEGIFPSMNGPSWSISTELGLYLAFLLLIGNFQRNWPYKILIAAVVTGSLIAAGLLFDLEWSSATPHTVTVQSLVYLFPPGRLFEFVSGMCMALLFRRQPLPDSLGPASMAILEFSILALVILNALLAQMAFAAWPNALTMYASFSAVIPACLAIYVFAQQRGPVSWLLARSPFVLLGEISYATYLLHVPVGRYFFQNKAATMLDSITLAFCLLCLLGLSYLSWALFETPVRTAIKRSLIGVWRA
jgi:peptidoglycan/LPS O-acetylase OafA/YrhL